MYVITEPPAFACPSAVTFLAGIVHDDGVALVADRASTHSSQLVSVGPSASEPDARMVFASEDGTLVAGIVGVAVTADVNVLEGLSNLLRHPLASAGATVADLHAPLVHLCTQAAPSIQAYSPLPTQADPFTQPAHTVILLGGLSSRPGSPARTQLVAYGITDGPDPDFHCVRRSVVHAPASVQADAERMLRQHATYALDEQVSTWRTRPGAVDGYSVVVRDSG